MLPGAAPPSRDLEPAAVGFDEPIDVSPLQSAAKVNDDGGGGDDGDDDDDDDDGGGDGDDDDDDGGGGGDDGDGGDGDDDDDNNNVTKCIVCVQGHDPLTFSFLSSFLFYVWVGVLWP